MKPQPGWSLKDLGNTFWALLWTLQQRGLLVSGACEGDHQVAAIVTMMMKKRKSAATTHDDGAGDGDGSDGGDIKDAH